MKYIVIGTSFVDIKGFPEGVFRKNGRNAGDIQYVHGGVGRNIAENLGRLGRRPVFVSTIDDSPFGSAVTERLKEENVNTDYILKAENGLGTWMAIFDDSGDVTASISKRCDLSALIPLLEDHEEDLFPDADSILLEIDTDARLAEKTFYYAGKYNIPVYAVISNMDIAIKTGVFHYPISCLVCNEQEAGMLFSKNFGGFSADDIEREIRRPLPEYPIEKLVVTLGEKGAVYYDHREQSGGWIPAVPTEVCDTTGAGDAFFTGVSIGLTHKKPLQEASGLGARLAASVISTKENVCVHTDMNLFE